MHSYFVIFLGNLIFLTSSQFFFNSATVQISQVADLAQKIIDETLIFGTANISAAKSKMSQSSSFTLPNRTRSSALVFSFEIFYHQIVDKTCSSFYPQVLEFIDHCLQRNVRYLPLNFNVTGTQNHLISLAKWLSVSLRTKCLLVQVPLQ